MGSATSFNFIDLFAGAGGLSCGLELAGHRCLLGVDSNKHAMATFAHNHHHAQVFCDAIEKLTEEKLKELTRNERIHLVVGGPPCQGFSTVGRGDPKDSRNRLFLQFLRVVELCRPDYIVMENVTGLLATKNSQTLKAIIRKFKSLGFHLQVQVMSAEDYGVAERRRRTIFIGSRFSQEITFPTPSHPDPVTLGEILFDLTASDGCIYNHDLKEAAIPNPLDQERIKYVPEGKGIRYREDELCLPRKLRHDIDWDKIPEGRFRQTRYLRLDRKKHAPTILTDRHQYYHPTECRFLTVREAARIQSFPNDFVFTGPITSKWRQIGNAVPPLLGKAIGEHLKKLSLAAQQPLENAQMNIAPQDLSIVRGNAFIYHPSKKETHV